MMNIKIRLTIIAAAYIAVMSIVAPAVGDCGQGLISDAAYKIRDTIDRLPTMPPGEPVSDPFLLLANEVSNRSQLGLAVTSNDLVTNCSMEFEGIVHDLTYLDYGDNWDQILKAYETIYAAYYPAIKDALNRFKDKAESKLRLPNKLLNVLNAEIKKELANLFGVKPLYTKAELATKTYSDFQEFSNWEPDFKDRVLNHLYNSLNDQTSRGYKGIRDDMPIANPDFNPFIGGRLKTFGELTNEEKDLLVNNVAIWDPPFYHNFLTYKMLDGVDKGLNTIKNVVRRLL